MKNDVLLFQIVFDIELKCYRILDKQTKECYGEYESIDEAENEKYNLELRDRS